MMRSFIQLLFGEEDESTAGQRWIVVSGEGKLPGSSWAALVQAEADGVDYGSYRFTLGRPISNGERVVVRQLFGGEMVGCECVIGASASVGARQTDCTAFEVTARGSTEGGADGAARQAKIRNINSFGDEDASALAA